MRKALLQRMRNQGVRVTLLWIYARSWPAITGVPIVEHCRITPNIWVGPQFRRAGQRRLIKYGITACVNLRHEFDDKAHHLFFDNYCYLPTIDDTSPTIDQIKEGVHFIQNMIRQGGVVYIHCNGGIGRGPTLAAAYFISQGMKIDDAIEKIRIVRPYINILSEQKEKLHQFESLLIRR